MANESSPIRKVTPHYAQHHRPAVQDTAVDDMEVIECQDFFTRLLLPSETIHQLKKIRYNEPPKKNFELDETPVEFIVGYGNLVSGEVKRRLAPRERRRVFRNTGNLAPGDHPTGTRSRPDITVVASARKIPHDEAPNWGEIESLSEVHSKGTSQPNSVDQAYAYTAYLLQARPDRVVILTFWAGKAGMCFIIADALGYQRTPVLAWRGEEGRLRHRLFCALVYRLYLPHHTMVDPSIERHGLRTVTEGGKKKCYFLFYVDWKQDKEAPSGAAKAKKPKRAENSPTYYIKHVGHPIGRRSIVFRNFENPITVNGMQVDIIKEQYVPTNPKHRFQETDIIEHIHKEGPVPGVVQMIRYEEVECDDGKVIRLGQDVGISMEERTKIRIAECNMGESFVELKTPREMLIAAYDTLAITRYLFSKRGVLHRDISKGNVMCISDSDSEEQTPSNQTDDAMQKPSIPVSDLCCATYLLKENKKDWTALMATLIDYDHAEILDEKETEERAGRTGTAVFIARAVLHGGHLHEGIRTFSYPRMPDPPDQRYRDTYPDRIAKFPIPASPWTDVSAINITASQLRSPLRHELRHDAESIFWLMFYWMILAWPEGGKEIEIPGAEWGHLTASSDDDDNRDVLFYRGRIPKNVVHGDYEFLEPLILELWSHIQYDHHFAPSGPLRDPEYVHEALQRCILSFLIKHGESDFMTKKKRDIHREAHSFRLYPTELSDTAITNIRRSSTRGAETNTRPIPPYRFEPRGRTAIGSPPAAYSDFLTPSVQPSSESSSSHSQPSRSPSPEQRVAKKTKRAPAPARRRSSRPNPPKEGGSSLLKKARKVGKAMGKAAVDMVTPAGRKKQDAKRTKSPKEPSSVPSQASPPTTSQLTPPRRSNRLLKRDAPDDPPDESESVAQRPKRQRKLLKVK